MIVISLISKSVGPNLLTLVSTLWKPYSINLFDCRNGKTQGKDSSKLMQNAVLIYFIRLNFGLCHFRDLILDRDQIRSMNMATQWVNMEANEGGLLHALLPDHRKFSFWLSQYCLCYGAFICKWCMYI